MINKVGHFLYKHWFGISISIIMLLALFLRFYNYDNRWGIAYDQARDILVAKEALRSHKIPLIGPFSSAGQFVYGPQWFWALMGMIQVYPSSLLTPWIVHTVLNAAMVLLMIAIGKEMIGNFFAIIAGLLIALSPSQVSFATNLISPSMVNIVSIISVYFFIRYIKYGKNLDMFLMSFSVATAVNIHFQAIGLFVLFLLALVFGKRNRRALAFGIAGTIIPFIPLIIFDTLNNHFESRNILDYYLHGQYKIYIPNRWLTYAGIFWPSLWGRLVSGNWIFGYFALFLLVVLSLEAFIAKQVKKPPLAIGLSFLFIFFMLRYYRGERFDNYYIFTEPFIILLTAWTIYRVFQINRIMGTIVAVLFFTSSMVANYALITSSTNDLGPRASRWKDLIIKTYPGKSFAMYDYGYGSPGFSLPLVLFLEKEGKIANNGYKIGFGSKPKVKVQDHKEVPGNFWGFAIRDLNGSSSAQLTEDGWSFINPSAIYHATEEWYFDKEL